MPHNWDKFTDKNLGFFNGMASEMHKIGQQLKRGWPDFSSAKALILASDYSGEHKTAPYSVFTFLLSDYNGLKNWISERDCVRKTKLKDSREMSYKKLQGDKVRQSALVPFLEAANQIPGILFSVLISKKLPYIYCLKCDTVPTDIKTNWKNHVWQKLMAITHFGGFLVGGMSSPMQDVCWFSDDDAIFANPDIQEKAKDVIGRIHTIFSQHRMGSFSFGSASTCDPGDGWIKDTLAVTDLAGGALSEFFEQLEKNMANEHASPIDTTTTPVYIQAQEKCERLLSWLAYKNQPLRKVTLRILPGKSAKNVTLDWESPWLQKANWR